MLKHEILTHQIGLYGKVKQEQTETISICHYSFLFHINGSCLCTEFPNKYISHCTNVAGKMLCCVGATKILNSKQNSKYLGLMADESNCEKCIRIPGFQVSTCPMSN